MDPLEHLLLVGSDQCVPQQFSAIPVLNDDLDTCADLLRLMSILVSLENQLPDEVKTAFERELYQLKIPDQTVADVTRELMSGDDRVCKHIQFVCPGEPDEVKTAFERELYQLKIPDQSVADVTRELMSGDDRVFSLYMFYLSSQNCEIYFNS